MKIIILGSASNAVARTAELIAQKIRSKPDAVLGLATGATMLPLYDALVVHHQRGLSFAGVTSFNLDEYVGLPAPHPQSYRSYMNAALFDRVDINLALTHLPQGDAPDPEVEAMRYEALIAQSGGIDLQLLGIGRNGHIGFNEPTSSLASRTRVKTLTRETRDVNRDAFGPGEDTPSFALTMGIANILEASECVLLATGKSKAKAVASAIEGPLAAICPASALQLHPKATFILDEDAAALLKLREYYLPIQPA